MFRFEDLEVWQRAVDFNYKIFDMAERVQDNKLYRFAEQLREASLSIGNNIAEGSGSSSKVEFRQYLGFAHRSCFEVANMLYIAGRRRIIAENVKMDLLKELEIISKMITNLKKCL